MKTEFVVIIIIFSFCSPSGHLGGTARALHASWMTDFCELHFHVLMGAYLLNGSSKERWDRVASALCDLFDGRAPMDAEVGGALAALWSMESVRCEALARRNRKGAGTLAIHRIYLCPDGLVLDLDHLSLDQEMCHADVTSHSDGRFRVDVGPRVRAALRRLDGAVIPWANLPICGHYYNDGRSWAPQNNFVGFYAGFGCWHAVNSNGVVVDSCVYRTEVEARDHNHLNRVHSNAVTLASCEAGASGGFLSCLVRCVPFFNSIV